MSRTPHTAEELSSEKTELKRTIGLFGSISILAGIMIGSGIFYIGGIVLERCGMNPALAIAVWLIGGAVTLLCGLSFAELGAMMPKAGGGYVYLREAYGERVAFIDGFCKFMISSPASIAALAVAFASALSSMVPIGISEQKVIAVAAVLILASVNVFGAAAGSLLQNALLVLKMLPILLILAFGLAEGAENPEVMTGLAESLDVSFAGPVSLISAVGFAVIAALWAYEGWVNLNCIAEEVKSPKRNIPLSLIASILGVTALYTLFNYSIFCTVPEEQIRSMIAAHNYYLGTAAAEILFGEAGKWIVGSAMLLAILNSLNGCILVFPRAFYAMARDGLMFKSLANLHPVYKTPVVSIFVSAACAVVLILFRSLAELTSLVAVYSLIFYGMTFWAVVKLRKKYPTMERPYKVWAYPASIVLICVITAALILNTFLNDPFTALIGIGFPALGSLIYEVKVRRLR